MTDNKLKQQEPLYAGGYTTTWRHIGGGNIVDSNNRPIGTFIGDFKDRDRMIIAVSTPIPVATTHPQAAPQRAPVGYAQGIEAAAKWVHGRLAGRAEGSDLWLEIGKIERGIRALAASHPQAAQPQTDETMEDPVMIPRGLLGAACYVARKHNPESTLLAKLRQYTFGEKSGLVNGGWAAQPQEAGQARELRSLIDLCESQIDADSRDCTTMQWHETKTAKRILAALRAAQAAPSVSADSSAATKAGGHSTVTLTQQQLSDYRARVIAETVEKFADDRPTAKSAGGQS